MDSAANTPSLVFHPLTSARWPDLESLFGPRGATGGCWCMWWRLPAGRFQAQKGEGNREAMKALVAAGGVPGLLAYHHCAPVGWCSVAPREEFPRLQRSRITAPVDDQRVWAVVCFFVVRKYRRFGVASGLLKAVIDFVRERGGGIVEGYPTDPATGRTADVFAYHGTASLFRRAGFTEVARRSPTRPVMRYVISGEPPGDMVARAAAEVPREHDQAGEPWSG